ncbi:MAG: hypothetical protein IJ150_13390 [Bacteroidales bacterium]|nr:hypothetical protein [Bacteroidales bacterium]
MKKSLINLLIGCILVVSCNDEDEHNKQQNQDSKDEFAYTSTGTISGFEYQDLGLSVKWATKNIGADNYYDIGYYISWGETQPKGDYTWSSYQHYDSMTKEITKYTEVTKDSLRLIRLETQDDAATVNLGTQWRMPTDAEITELRTKCDWVYIQMENGNSGYKVIGPNGKSIILPAGGYMKNNELKMFNKNVCFWSSELSINFAEKAYELTGYHSLDLEVFKYEGVSERFYGEPIRAVTTAD